MLFELTAKNVANINEFDEQITSQFENEDEKITKWIRSNFRRWLINEGPSILLEELPLDAPAWMKKAFAKGQEIHIVLYDVALQELRLIVDYFRHLVIQGQNIDRISVPQAIQKQKEWHEELKNSEKVSDIEDNEVVNIIKYDDGHSWVQLLGAKSLEREGEIMGHCVGGYYRQVASGITKIYSLRDKNNIPHITIEIETKRNLIKQAKAKGNNPVPVRYMKKVLNFLTELKVKKFSNEALGDLENTSKEEISEAYKEAGIYKDAVIIKDNIGNFSVVITDYSNSMPSFDNNKFDFYNNEVLLASMHAIENNIIIKFMDDSLEDLQSEEFNDLVAKYRFYILKKELSRFRITSFKFESSQSIKENVAQFLLRASRKMNKMIIDQATKFSDGNNKLLVAKSKVEAKLILKATNTDLSEKDGKYIVEPAIMPNTFVLDKQNKIKLSASVSYKNIIVVSGMMSKGISSLVSKISSGKTFVSNKVKEILEYNKELDIDPNFTYLTISPEVKNILHRGIFPSEKFNELMKELYQTSSLADYVDTLMKYQLVGKYPSKMVKFKNGIPERYKDKTKYKITKHRRRSNVYIVKDISKPFISKNTKYNIKAFFASLFCSPKTRKYLLKLTQESTPLGKAMMRILKLCANPVKLANVMLYGYDSHLRKNLIAATKLLRNLDKFFDREDITDPEILKIFDLIKAKRDAQQQSPQGEANPA